METVIRGRTGLSVSRLALGGYPFGGVNRANGWDPWSAAGRAAVTATIHRALDRGISYLDTAPAYGQGNSESLIGEVMRTRRDECVLTTKVGWAGLDWAAVTDSVRQSLRRLQTDHLDLVQFHGGMFEPADFRQIVEGGPLAALVALRDSGEIGHIGVTAEEPWTARQFLAREEFAVVQLAYNFIYQAAARHILDEARAGNVGVVTMRTMTSGVLQRLAKISGPRVAGRARSVRGLPAVRAVRLAGAGRDHRDALAGRGRPQRRPGRFDHRRPRSRRAAPDDGRRVPGRGRRSRGGSIMIISRYLL